MVELTSLKDLYIGTNRFTEFPSVLFDITTLKELGLANNPFSEIPSHISKLAYSLH